MDENAKLFHIDVEAINTEFRRKVRQLVIKNINDGCSLQATRISLEVVTSEVLDGRTTRNVQKPRDHKTQAKRTVKCKYKIARRAMVWE